MSLFLSIIIRPSLFLSFFFFNDTATTEIYTLSLHDALPISGHHLRVPVLRSQRGELPDALHRQGSELHQPAGGSDRLGALLHLGGLGIPRRCAVGPYRPAQGRAACERDRLFAVLAALRPRWLVPRAVRGPLPHGTRRGAVHAPVPVAALH